MTSKEKIARCLKSLISVNDWDACPFCGRNQRGEIDERPHDSDCPVKLADEVINVPRCC
jgi:hypothetical protein